MVATLGHPTIWGLSPIQLHDRYWASRGVQVVRQGEPSDIVDGAELFLLTDSSSLVLFDLRPLLDVLCWTKPDLLYVRLVDNRDRGYTEHALADNDDRFLRFERRYGGNDFQLKRVALTRNRELARLWQSSRDCRAGWKLLRRHVPSSMKASVSEVGRVYDRTSDQAVAEFIRRLVQVWKGPSTTIGRARRQSDAVWSDVDAKVDRLAKFVGPVWVGAGRSVDSVTSVVGPSVLWDVPSLKPTIEVLRWDQIEPSDLTDRRPPVPRSSTYRHLKRAFDIVFALGALLLTAPIYPLVMLAIWLEDGAPFFFSHDRETLGGRQFPCIKFRSMSREAERIKRDLARMNQADGPQFYINNDPRLTRVGRFIRATNIDELPQFINVLLGHMSVVGPRPSPVQENQYCPAWREARLSVRPGITGLWQVMRTLRPGLDFQEWIKYDIEYVETAGWRLDFWIIAQTIRSLL